MSAYLDKPSECRSCHSQFDYDGCLVRGNGCPDCLPEPDLDFTNDVVADLRRSSVDLTDSEILEHQRGAW